MMNKMIQIIKTLNKYNKNLVYNYLVLKIQWLNLIVWGKIVLKQIIIKIIKRKLTIIIKKIVNK